MTSDNDWRNNADNKGKIINEKPIRYIKVIKLMKKRNISPQTEIQLKINSLIEFTSTYLNLSSICQF